MGCVVGSNSVGCVVGIVVHIGMLAQSAVGCVVEGVGAGYGAVGGLAVPLHNSLMLRLIALIPTAFASIRDNIAAIRLSKLSVAIIFACWWESCGEIRRFCILEQN